MLIYRLETFNGGKSRGPFEWGGNLSNLIQNYFTHRSHPCPWDDGMTSKYAEFSMFGCPSFSALKYWMVATPEKRRHVLDHYESHENPDDILKMVKQTNKEVFQILKDDLFVIGRYLVDDQYCQKGRLGNQISFDRRHTIGRTEHRVEALFRGALM